LGTGASIIAAACPFCNTMLTDGVKEKDADVQVLDIAELVALSLAAASGVER
jgi:heterodisulfide reductase subunit D